MYETPQKKMKRLTSEGDKRWNVLLGNNWCIIYVELLAKLLEINRFLMRSQWVCVYSLQSAVKLDGFPSLILELGDCH